MIGEVILKNKLFSGESINIEYKVEMPKKSEKYMKTVVAFANGRGGRIVFGVDDKTLNIVGMNPDTIFQTMDSITNAISDSCEPKIYPDVTLQSIDDKTIIVVEIHPGPMRPYYIKNKGLVDGTYVRVAGTSRHAEGYMLKELILEGQNRYFDNEPCEYLEINEDDIKDLCDKMKKIAIIGSGSWGVALAIHLAKNGNNVKIWSFMQEEADLINNEKKCKFLPFRMLLK